MYTFDKCGTLMVTMSLCGKMLLIYTFNDTKVHVYISGLEVESVSTCNKL